jgi:hypothetical protein
VEKNPYLTPWIIPRWAIEGFVREVNYDSHDDYFVSQIIEHSPTQYLVITSGHYPEMDDYMKRYLAGLFKVEEDVESSPG